MDIGTGIAIAGVWVMVGAVALSKTITSYGWVLSLVIAIIVTVYLK